jgi:DivIVA domain-containing protein
MTSFEGPGGTSDRDPAATPPPGDERSPAEGPARDDRSARRFTTSRVMGTAERERVLTEVRVVDFPTALRGYDRVAVDRYVERVTRLITELEMSSSPEAAVRHALDEVSEETRDILGRAYQTADDIAARSRAKADDRLQEAEREAEAMLEAAHKEALEIGDAARRQTQDLTDATGTEVRTLRETAQRETSDLRERTAQETATLRETAAREAQQLRADAQHEADETRSTARREADTMVKGAEARTRELARDAETIWRERRRLIDDMRAVGDQIVAIGEAEGKRFPHPMEGPVPGSEHSDEPGPNGTNEPAVVSAPGNGGTEA